MSLKKKIEDAVIAILNGGSFSQDFTAARGPKSIKKLQEVEELQVLVAAYPTKKTRLVRNKAQWEFAVSVGLSKKVGFVDGELDRDGAEEVNAVAEEIAEALDVELQIEGGTPNGPLVPEIDYEPDDGALENNGIAAVQINSPYLFWVDRAA